MGSAASISNRLSLTESHAPKVLISYSVEELVAKTAKQLKRIEKRAAEVGDTQMSHLVLQARLLRQQKSGSTENADLQVAYKLCNNWLGEDGKINGSYKQIFKKLTAYSGGDIEKATNLGLAGIALATRHFSKQDWLGVKKMMDYKLA